MDIKEYIESGVVEMYALGSLTDAERKEFEQKFLMYPELARELNMVQEALANYADAHSINPRPSLRSEILNDVVQNGERKAIRPAAENPVKNHSLTYKYLIAASLAALAISTFASWFFFNRWEDSEERFSNLLSEKNQLAQNYNMLKDGFDKTVYDLLVMRDPQSAIVTLYPEDSTVTHRVRVYSNMHTHEIFIDVLNLPEAPANHEYRLWAIQKGDTLDAGAFDAAEFIGIQRMKDVPFNGVWMVTLDIIDDALEPEIESQVLLSSANPPAHSNKTK